MDSPRLLPRPSPHVCAFLQSMPCYKASSSMPGRGTRLCSPWACSTKQDFTLRPAWWHRHVAQGSQLLHPLHVLLAPSFSSQLFYLCADVCQQAAAKDSRGLGKEIWNIFLERNAVRTGAVSLRGDGRREGSRLLSSLARRCHVPCTTALFVAAFSPLPLLCWFPCVAARCVRRVPRRCTTAAASAPDSSGQEGQEKQQEHPPGSEDGARGSAVSPLGAPTAWREQVSLPLLRRVLYFGC